MKSFRIIVVACILFQSCISTDDKIDIKKAKRLVYLDTNDLVAFSQLRQQMINDSIKIKEQNDETASPYKQSGWFTTNSYYLKQIDSPRYATLYEKLKGKLVDNIYMNRNGSTIFTIKANIQMHSDDYDESYEHQLIYTNCNCPIQEIFSNVDTVYVDSTITKKWKYRFFKALTGH
jgi:hypothetical protein